MDEHLSERIMVIAPFGNDAERISTLLAGQGFTVKTCSRCPDCCEEMAKGAGALILTEEAFNLPSFADMLKFLKKQPTWSELPVIILSTGGGEKKMLKVFDLIAQAAGSITLLERPLSAVTLLRSTEVALRSRRRQYHVRGLIETLNSLTSQLEKKVEERTSQLEDRAEHLRHLAAELTKIEEEERKRLAQILHDHLQQLLVAAKMRLGMFERDHKTHDGQSIKEVQAFLEQAYDASRSLTAELRPPVLYEGGLVAALHFLVRKYQKDHGLTIHLTAREEAEPRSEVLKAFIYQSLRELILNVIKYAHVHECFLKLEKLDNTIRIELRDQGTGFNPSDIETKGVGGFGLFSIKERVRALGGEFVVTSSPGAGSNFEIKIADEGQIPEQAPVISALRPAKDNKTGFLRILIADDHKIVRQSLAQVLVMQPFVQEVIEAEDGRDAIMKVEEFNPDIVLMDLNMPHLNGMEATRVLHQRDPHLKIIGLSVQSEEETAQAMKKAGAIEYLNKNTDTDILVETLKSLARTRQA